MEDPSELKFKEGDRLAFLVPAETTDRLLLFASDGRFFTLGCAQLPSARGQGEPLRLMLDLDDRTKLTAVFPFRAGRKRVLASSGGYGFLVAEDELLANRRAGKAVLHVGGLRDGLVLAEGEGLSTVDPSGRRREWPEWREFLGKRASSGRVAPRGFPASKRFRPKA